MMPRLIVWWTYLKWIFKYLLRGDWALGAEMGYWDVELNIKRPMGWIQEMFKEDIIPAIDHLRSTFSTDIDVLELGPGPVSRLTEGWESGLFRLTAVDPLADEYKKNFRNSPFLVKGYGENLDSQFEEGSFHMCYASNSLDHVKSPLECMRNLFKLTRVGGLIIVQGNVREGSRTNWRGGHNFNLYLDGDQLVCEEKNGRAYELTRGLETKRLFKRVRTWSDPENESVEWFSITYRRIG